MRYIKKSETEPRDLREYKKNCRKASPPLKITYKDVACGKVSPVADLKQRKQKAGSVVERRRKATLPAV